MNFDSFINKIDTFKTKQLGGKKSQFKLVPKLRLQFSEEEIIKNNPKKAAVLALFYPDKNNQTKFLLTERASYKGTHSAQISFPGGKMDLIDKNLTETALRETFEEVGIQKEQVTIIRALSETYIPPSNYLVSPFLGFSNHTPTFNKNYEVETIIEVFLEDLLNNKNVSSFITDTSYMKNTSVPCFKLNNYVVWGATAMILSEVKDLLK